MKKSLPRIVLIALAKLSETRAEETFKVFMTLDHRKPIIQRSKTITTTTTIN